MRNGFALPPHLEMANFKSAQLRGGVQGGKGQESGLAAYVAGQIDHSLSWKDLAWVRSITKLPLVLKGSFFETAFTSESWFTTVF